MTTYYLTEAGRVVTSTRPSLDPGQARAGVRWDSRGDLVIARIWFVEPALIWDASAWRYRREGPLGWRVSTIEDQVFPTRREAAGAALALWRASR